MFKKMNRIVGISMSLFLWFGITGCISMPFEIAGSVIESTGDVVESVVEIPFDVADGIFHVPPSLKSKYTDEQNWTITQEGMRSDEQNWSLSLDEIQEIDVDNTNGNVTVNGLDDDRITIHAYKEVFARDMDLAHKYMNEVQIHVEKQGEKLRIYKTPEESRSDRYFDVIRYEIGIPRSLRVDVSVHNASVDLSGLDTEIRVESQNGNISVKDSSGMLIAKTNNGRIQSELNQLWQSSELISHNGSIDVVLFKTNADLFLETHNGSIKLLLPDWINGRIDAQTNNGSLQTDIPVRVTSPQKDQLVGQLGSGEGPELKLHSHNGSIRIGTLPK